MAFDPEVHAIDPNTGFIVDKEHGHNVGIVPAPLAASVPADFPKWVQVHLSHINGGVAQAFAETFTARDGVVSVLVHDAEEEAKAVAEKITDIVEHNQD